MIRNQADVIREQPHYRLQKTTLGVASVLLGTTLYFGGVAHADTNTNVEKGANVTAVTSNSNSEGNTVNKTGLPADNSQGTTEEKPSVNVEHEPVTGSENEQPAPHNDEHDAVVNDQEPSADNQDKDVNNQKAMANDPNLNTGNPNALLKQKDNMQQKQLTRTINIKNPVNGDTTQEVQTVTYQRANETSPWEAVGSDTFPEYNKLPHFPGFEPYDANGGNAVMNGKVLAVSTTPNMTNLIVNVAYRQADGHAMVELKDQTTGKVVDVKNYVGKYGSVQKVSDVIVPDGYKLADGQMIPTEIRVANNNRLTVNLEPVVVHLTNTEFKTTDDVIPGTHDIHFPTGLLKDDLNRKVSRTFVLKYPDGTSKKVVQGSVEFTRDATVNAVTGHVDYGKWSHDGSYTFPAFNVPQDPNMLVKSAETGPMTVTPDYLPVEIFVEYQYKAASQRIKFVDVADAGTANPSALDEKTYTGHAGEEVSTDDLQLPAGYQLVKGQAIPKTIILKAGNVAPINVIVEEQHVKVTADNPKEEGDEIPGTDGWCWYPSGVAKDDLNKVITRTVNLYEPGHGDKPTVVSQLAHLTRDAIVGAISLNVKYGDWSTGEWKTVEIPQFKGYTADVKNISQAPVTATTDPVEINVHYVKNSPTQVSDQKDITQTIKYVFADGKSAGDDHVVTKTITRLGSKDAVTDAITWHPWIKEEFKAVETPEIHGYTPDQKIVPSALLDDNQLITVTYTKNAPKVDTQNSSFTRTIHYRFSDGTPAGDDVVQTSNWQRKVYTDAVTGEKTYDPWLNLGTPDYTAVNTKALHGYTADKTVVNSIQAKPENTVVVVTYTKNPATKVEDTKTVKQVVYFVNTDGKALQKPDEQTVTLHRIGSKDAVTDQITWGAWDKADFKVVNAPEFHGYTADKAEVKANPATSDKAFTITYRKNAPTKVSDQKQVTRTINFVDDQGQKLADPQVQTVTLTRMGSKDAVTDQITWDNWSKATFDAVDAPSVKGYTPKMSKINAQLATDNVTVNDVYALNPMIKVSESREYTRTINYNFADHYTVLPSVIQKSTVSRDGQKNPATDAIVWGNWSTPKFDAVKSPLVHGYTADQPVVDSSTKAGNTVITVNYKRDLDQDVLKQQKVTQTIKYVFDDGRQALPNDVQVLTRTRTGVQNAVTDEITWNDWENDQYKDVKSPEIKGYTPDVKLVKGSTADQDKTIVVTYVKNAPEKVTDQKTVTRTIKYVFADGKPASKPVSQVVTLTRHGLKDAVSGEVAWEKWSTDGFDAVKSPIIHGYTSSQDTVAAVKNADKNTDVTVTYTKNAPTHVTDHKTIKRTIKYVFADGKPAGKTVEQSAEITREGSKDAVSDEVSWSDWSKGHFTSVKSPVIHGYTASVDNVKDQFSDHDENIVVKYTKQKDQEITDYKVVTRTIEYVFDNGQQAAKPTKQSVRLTRVGLKDPATDKVTWGNWTKELFTSVKAPEIHGYTADQPVVDAGEANGDVKVIVHYKKNAGTIVKDTQNVTRTINYVYENGKQAGDSVKQVVKLTRTGVKDAVSGDITWNDWSTGQFEKVASPKLHGYTADKDSVASQAATNGENPVVTVTYSKNAPEKVTDQKLLSQTIRYQFSNGVPAHENHVQTVLVKRTGEKDAVSGEITWGPWDDVSFKAVKSPEIDGYEPDVKEVDAVRAVGNIDTDLTVTYHKVKDESATKGDQSEKGTKTDQPENGAKTDQSEKGTKTPGGSLVDTGKQPVKSDKNTGKSGEKISHDTNGHNVDNQPVKNITKVTGEYHRDNVMKGQTTARQSTVTAVADNHVNSSKNSQTKAHKLPQTGTNQNETEAGVLGLLTGGLVSLFGLKKKREEK